ncbi:MAG: L,D-transpeptidase family protein, partial [Pseudomonadota bacterium]
MSLPVRPFRPIIIVATAATVLAATPAAAEVPVPRLSPGSAVIASSLAGPIQQGPATRAAMRRETKVDVSHAVAEFYEANNFEPIWAEEKETALRKRLGAARLDGLDPSAYALPAPGTLSPASMEVALSEAALRYARHATSGQVDPKSVSRIITLEPHTLDEVSFLHRLRFTTDVARTLDRLHPTNPEFVALKKALAAELERGKDMRVAVGRGKALRKGSRGPRVAVLRARIGATVPRGTDPARFDAALDVAVRDWQREHGLSADGIVGPRTIAVLDEGIGVRDETAILANMERWRWMPRDLGEHHVFVNIPAYRVKVRSGGEEIYDGRVIVGAAHHPTPIFSDEIEHVVVNPYWNVPVSIASKEMLGGIQKNPAGYFARRGYEAVVRGRVVNPASIAWNASTVRQVRIRQRPGRGNALGAVKFLFPNQHSVYLHDTS